MSLLSFGSSGSIYASGCTPLTNFCHSEVVEKFPKLRSEIAEKLISTFGDIKSGKVYRGALWIVGEYCEDAERESGSN
jgi:hypothetical protein